MLFIKSIIVTLIRKRLLMIIRGEEIKNMDCFTIIFYYRDRVRKTNERF